MPVILDIISYVLGQNEIYKHNYKKSIAILSKYWYYYYYTIFGATKKKD